MRSDNDTVHRLVSSLNSTHWSFTYYDATECPATLIAALQQKLPHIPQDSWTKRLQWGGGYLNGRTISSDVSLVAPCRIEYFEPRFELEEAHNYFPKFSEEWIVYEDPDLLVAFKPENLLCLPGRDQPYYNLKRYIQNHLKNEQIHFASRLDVSVCGLVPISKSPRMHRALQQIFENHQVGKSYLLETVGDFPTNPILVDLPIGRNPMHPVLRQVDLDNGLVSQTRFNLVGNSSITASEESVLKTSIVEAQPISGRTHQIRVHVAHLGYPIVGDEFYGGFPSSSLHLASFRLRFIHPFAESVIDVTLPKHLQPDWLRNLTV